MMHFCFYVPILPFSSVYSGSYMYVLLYNVKSWHVQSNISDLLFNVSENMSCIHSNLEGHWFYLT